MICFGLLFVSFLLLFSFSHFKGVLGLPFSKKQILFPLQYFGKCWLTQIWDTLVMASDWLVGCLTSSDYLSAKARKCIFCPFAFCWICQVWFILLLWKPAGAVVANIPKNLNYRTKVCVHVCGDQKQSDLIERFHGNLIFCCHCRILQNVWLPGGSFGFFKFRRVTYSNSKLPHCH